MKLKNNILKKTIFSVIFLFLTIGLFGAIKPLPVFAIGGVVTDSPKLDALIKGIDVKRRNTETWTDKAYKVMKNAFVKAVGTALKTMAYDTATWVGSGNKGQKPLFLTEGWDVYKNNILDNAAGAFLEELGKSNGFLKFNLCEPNLDIKIKIGLGLTQYARPSAPACSFTKMTQNWTTAAQKIKDMGQADYLKKAQEMFDPTSNDVGVSFALQTGIIETQTAKLGDKDKERTENEGWLRLQNIAGKNEDLPKNTERTVWQSTQAMYNNITSADPNTLTGAIVASGNIFLNQYAITAFNTFLAGLGKDLSDTTSPYGDMSSLFSKEAAPSTSGIAGITGAIATLQNAKVDFTVRADYNILGELAACPDPTKAGPTNCVITDKFVQAVSEKKTVGEAIKAGYLNSAGSFGFNDGYEPKYMDEAYPYRSLIILRKYRILPVGWELAGQYIKNEQSKTGYVDGDVNFNLGQLVACFNPDDEYTGYNDDDSASDNWCEGLVDPNWVLKAPTNYCKRQGFGPEIVSQSVVGTGLDSYVGIARNENYCADEQSCIKENNDGSCAAYGYCSKERRKWDFGSKSCDAKYNTCQTFKTSEGQSVSYLENTLDYAGCSADNAGCKAYAVKAASYNTGSSSIVWSGTDPIHLDRDAETCDADNEGCHEFIRIKTGSGANLIANSSFEDDLAGTFGEGKTAETSDAYDGAKSLKLDSGGLSKSVQVAPYDYSIGSERFTLSFYAKNCGTTGTFGIGGVTNSLDTDVSSWTRQVFTYIYPSNITGNEVAIAIAPPVADCLIDAIKLERNSQATAYSDYGAEGVVYEKLLPAYLSNLSGSNLCYNNDGSAKSDAPDECANFVRKCTVDEVNCDMYTSATDGVEVPAKVTVNDYCQAECVGYDTYVQNATTFDTQRSEYFIPSSAKVCGAEAAGCEEFTNLDKLEKGGEAVEHYSYLRQCIKPDTAACAEFYTWEGSDESGFQLKVMQLKKDNANDPASTNSDAAEEANACSESIYNLTSTDPSYNSDCRQFYNKTGVISYRLMTHTISCSDDCFAYRMARINIDENIIAATDCAGADKNWDSATNQCAVCENGGKWKIDLGACVYEAVPAEGAVCAAKDNGCREYGGNAGNNMMVVLNNSFEGSSEGWISVSSVTGSTAVVDNNSLTVGGQSLAVNLAAETVLGSLLQKDKSYVLSFIAKGNALNISLSASIADQNQTNITKISAFTGAAVLSSAEWKRFELNLPKLDHEVTDNETLSIFGTGKFYIDDVKLTEITDRYYLIQDSWATPDSCNEDANGDPYPLFALGCDAYSDLENNTHYLHSFSHLCQDSAVGCELMIDTQNSADYQETEYAANAPTVTITEDVFDYVVFDKEKQCSAIDKGCQRLGKPYKYETTTLYSDVYLKNDPDKYSTILCGSEAAECSEWATNDGNVYFRDPGAQTCEWRQGAGAGASGGWGWYKTKIKKCSGGTNLGKVCSKDGDCPESTCVKETSDNSCPTDGLKTFGEGGSEIYQPTSDSNGHWAGLCPASESSCSEYIDPVSEFSNGLAVNNSVKLLTNTLYIIDSGTIGTGFGSCRDDKGVALNSNIFYFLNSDNTLALPPWATMSVAGNGSQFYVGKYGTSAYITCPANASVRQAAVDYQLKDGVDTETCNGNVDFETGCVLFNERAQDGSAGLASLSYDSFLTLDDGLGMSPTGGTTNNANKLLKVIPDRECAEWIGCEESNTSGVCTKLGLCNKLDDSNTSCERFITPATASNRTYPGITIDNMSGYAKAAYYNININDPIHPYPDDYYQFEKMESVGAIANVSNGGFELNEVSSASTVDYDDRTFKPTGGWDCADTTDTNCYNNINVLNNPVSIQTDRVCFRTDGSGNCTAYAPEGNSILKVSAPYGSAYIVQTKAGEEISAASSSIKDGWSVDNSFIITGYVNTSKMSMGKVSIQVTELQFLNTETDGLTISYDTKAGPYEIASSSAGNDWTAFFKRIDGSAMHDDTTNLRITLTAENGADVGISGSYYFDDIKIRPILESRSDFSNQQTCRLYPQENSLTCDYYDASGIRYKGLYGYCLEYDRFPGSADTCLQWWPVPNKNNNSDSASELSEVCGDAQASGNEDCDCKQVTGDPTTTYCNASNDGYYNPAGTSKDSQYACSTCGWTGGWCGDNIIESTDPYNETCDWNESETTSPNLTGSTNCITSHTDSEIKKDFAHTDSGYTYYDYLYGVDDTDSIGCYNNSGKADDLDFRCRINTENCSDDLYNGDHSRADCIAAGGLVVNKSGDEVTNSEGKITGSAGYSNKEFFCKFSNVGFTGGRTAADLNNLCVLKGGVGWKSYGSNGWVTNSASSCNSNGAWDGMTECGGEAGTSVLSSIFSDVGQKTSTGKDEYTDSDMWGSWCGTSNFTCYAGITEVGCY